MDGDGWDKLLAFGDRSLLTLPLGRRCPAEIPDRVRDLLKIKFADNAERWQRVKTAYTEVAGAFEPAGIDFVVLKGFSQCPYFVSDPRYRAQYDLDVWLSRDKIHDAHHIALRLGYEPIAALNRLPVDHLPTLIRKTGWQWRGNYFDPDLPLSLELHFRLWDEHTEKLKMAGLEGFWGRRERRGVDGLEFTGLSKTDAVAYASIHLLRHLLRGDVRPYHLYELALFHENTAAEPAFWQGWSATQSDDLRRVQAICASLAQAWFGCRLSDIMRQEVEQLHAPVRRWLSEYAFSPLSTLFQPNKDELWLHLSLLDSTRAKAAILRRRLLPVSLPGTIDATHVRDEDVTIALQVRRSWRYSAFLVQRLTHHAMAFPGVLVGGVAWILPDLDLSREYWRFFVAAGLYDFGMFVFFLLYNLYLLQLGFGERFIGFVSSAMLAGSIAGSIPAGLAIQRFGLRNTLLGGFIAVALLSAMRATVTLAPALIALAVCVGFVSSTWAVAISPCVAHLTTPKNRALGFSLVFSSGIGIGVFGGVIGGRLPAWLARLSSRPVGALQYREALLAGCAFALLAVWPALRLRLAADKGPVKLRLPGPRLSRYLAAAAVWNLGTGAFNPFFSAYFARLQTGVETIGLIFSTAQMAQVAAVLMAPMVLRRLGLIRGISWMQLLTGVALLLLSTAVGPLFAALAYAAFMVFQYMSEPGLYTLLMDSVRQEERSQASALNFMVASSAQAVAAAASGAAIEKLGYGTVLVAASSICIIAGMLFRTLLDAAPQSSAPDTA